MHHAEKSIDKDCTGVVSELVVRAIDLIEHIIGDKALAIHRSLLHAV